MTYVPDPDGYVAFQINRRRELAAGRCTKCGTLTPGWKR